MAADRLNDIVQASTPPIPASTVWMPLSTLLLMTKQRDQRSTAKGDSSGDVLIGRIVMLGYN